MTSGSGSAQRRRTLFRALLLLLSAVIIANGQTTQPEITPCPPPAPAQTDSFCYHLPTTCTAACTAKVTILWDPESKILTFKSYVTGIKRYTAAGISGLPAMGPGFAVGCIRESETNVTSHPYVIPQRGVVWRAVDDLAHPLTGLSDVVKVATPTEATCTFNMTIPFLAIPHPSAPLIVGQLSRLVFIYASGASNDNDPNGPGIDKHADLLRSRSDVLMLSDVAATTTTGAGGGAGGSTSGGPAPTTPEELGGAGGGGSSGHVHQSSAWTFGVVVVLVVVTGWPGETTA